MGDGFGHQELLATTFLTSSFTTGYEIYGLEKIPEEGPALIVYYHGAIPVDYYYFLARVIIQKGRTCHSVADHFLFKVPGKHRSVSDEMLVSEVGVASVSSTEGGVASVSPTEGGVASVSPSEGGVASVSPNNGSSPHR